LTTPVIGIDVHCIGQRQTGNETYIRNLVEQFSMMPLPWEFIFYHTLPEREFDSSRWRGALRRVRPTQSLLRIPLAFPYYLRRDAVALAHFQYVAPPLCPCPTIVTVHDISYEHFPEYFNPLQRARMRLLIPLSARRAAEVLTVSEYSRRDIIDRYGIPEERVTVTYNGVSEAFHVQSPEEALAATASFKIDRPFILGVGNLQARKNLLRLIRAYARLRDSGDCDHDLFLVGQAAWKGHQIQSEVVRLGITQFVRRTGYVSEEQLIGLYNRAELFVYPSTFEGFGLPVIEAMACGTPVLTSNTSALPEIAGDAAVTVNPYDEDAIGDGLRRLLKDDALRSRLRVAGLLRARDFSWRAVAERTAQAYARALSSRK
jgi:glycosyltransferase involved in cell wall biosynthesis